MTVLSIPAFGAGVVKEGSADSQRTDELSVCDSLDIGRRGQLAVTTDVTAFGMATGTLDGSSHPIGLSPVFGMEAAAHPKAPILFFIGSDGTQVVYASLMPDGSLATGGPIGGAPVAPVAGLIVTFASFPYVNTSDHQVRVMLISIAARSFQYPNSGFGLYVIQYDATGPSYTFLPISKYDALGTGANGEFPGGNRSRQLAPRGVVAYNNHAFIWGFDSKDPGGDGPNRFMFSNPGNPLKWGLDPNAQAIADGDAESNRAFEDSDAIELGGSGEGIRCGYVWRGKLWAGTNRELHYIEGFGRESFKTNGSLPLARSRNVISARAMIEGPDALLYGVSDQGLWRCDGAAVDGIGDKLRDFEGRSSGYWDLIWTDPTATELAFPGRTNQDLVWMITRKRENQVWVVIPYCNAVLGYGAGPDTVVIKYHVLTGGFTRQVFLGRALTCGAELTRETQADAQTYLCNSTSPENNVLRYGYRPTLLTSPILPIAVPDVTIGPYAPFGPNGVGVMGRWYATLSWEASALPIVFTCTLTADGQVADTVRLAIGSAAALGAFQHGDILVDTTGTDTNLGNGTAGTIVTANPGDYLIRRYVGSWAKFVAIGSGGQQGTRVTVPIVFAKTRGSRFSIALKQTAASGRYQLENVSEKPMALIREAV